MRRFLPLFFFLFFSFYSFAENCNISLQTAKSQALAVGEISLAYRLQTLTMSLAAAKAVESDYIFAILSEIDATIINGKSLFLQNNSVKTPVSEELVSAFDTLLLCSEKIRKYSKNMEKSLIPEIEKCFENSRKKLDKLSDLYQKKEKQTKNSQK